MKNLHKRKMRRTGMYLLIVVIVVILAFPLYWMAVTKREFPNQVKIGCVSMIVLKFSKVR